MSIFGWRTISLREKTRRHQLHLTRQTTLASKKLFSADLVVLARSSNPIPFRTRPLIFSALMVLSLKAWESKSLPGLPRTVSSLSSWSKSDISDFDLHDVECLDAEEPPREISQAAFSIFKVEKCLASLFGRSPIYRTSTRPRVALFRVIGPPTMGGFLFVEVR
jgi:hypothetical protein